MLLKSMQMVTFNFVIMATKSLNDTQSPTKARPA